MVAIFPITNAWPAATAFGQDRRDDLHAQRQHVGLERQAITGAASDGGTEVRITCNSHGLCDRQGNTLQHCLTAGQTHESQALEALLEGATLCDLDDEPVIFPLQLAGDKGYRAWEQNRDERWPRGQCAGD